MGNTSRWVSIQQEQTPGAIIGSPIVMALDSETLEMKPKIEFVTRSAYSQQTASHSYGLPISGDLVFVAPVPEDLLYCIEAFAGRDTYTFTNNSPVTSASKHAWNDLSNLAPSTGINVGGSTKPPTKTIKINYDVNYTLWPSCWATEWRLRQMVGQPLEATFSFYSGPSASGSATPSAAAAATNATTRNYTRGFGDYSPSITSLALPSGQSATRAFNIFNAFTGGTEISSIFKGLDLRITRQYDTNLFTGGSRYLVVAQTPGSTMIRGTLTTDLSSAYGANDIIQDLLAVTERGIEFAWVGDAAGISSTKEVLDIQIANLVWSGGMPHMRANRTPAGYEGQFTFEAYKAPPWTSAGLGITVISGQNGGIAGTL